MSTTSAQNYITADTLRVTGSCMIAVASTFFLGRSVARCLHLGWRLQIEDFVISLAFVFFLSLSIAYLVIIDPMYRINAVESGETAIYPTMMEDAAVMTKVFFCTTMLLWFELWSVKAAFLLLIRRLMIGLPNYLRWWWAITLIGAVISNFTSCASMHEWFTPGLCDSHRDSVAEIASLYYAFAVDAISDLMIMILPIRLLWNLRVPTYERLGIVATFAVGSLCIIAAIVRVISIGSKAGDSTPSSSWLALWAMIEGAIAIVVACLPSFAIAVKRSQSTRHGYSYGNRATDDSKRRQQGVPLATIGSAPRFTPNRSAWSANVASSSEEDILRKPDEITIVRTTNVDHSDVDS
ncbi:hypothetical protein LTR85_007055 [Meristemomyces frigidus]|nr:hypothetical protein LTR85_007055 [Meristemomyces frigidus]